MNEMASPLWIQFLESMRQAKADLGDPDVLWYRGQPNARFPLLATLLRYENGLAKERSLFTNFKKFSDRILKRRNSDWETLFEMQHYGVPTRLLDWSEAFGVALFFAATDNQRYHPNEDAAMYLLDPMALNRIGGRNRIVRVPEDEDKFSYTGIYLDPKLTTAIAPVAIEPIFFNERILAQRGMFTVHHDKIDPIENSFPGATKKVILPKAAIPAALEFLVLSNLNIFSVFPDLGGLSRYLKSTAGLKPRGEDREA